MDGIESALVAVCLPFLDDCCGRLARLDVSGVTLLCDAGACLRWPFLRRWNSFSIELSESSSCLCKVVLETVSRSCIAEEVECLAAELPFPKLVAVESATLDSCWVSAGRFPGMPRVDTDWVRAARVLATTDATLVSGIGFFLGLSMRSWR